MKNKDAVTGLLVGIADTAERAASVAGFFEKCPYCGSVSHTGKLVLAVLSFPASRKWWFDSMADDPAGTVGLRSAEALYPQRINAQSPWSSGHIEPQRTQPPCGADCSTCRMYQHNCPGCPASRSFIE